METPVLSWYRICFLLMYQTSDSYLFILNLNSEMRQTASSGEQISDFRVCMVAL